MPIQEGKYVTPAWQNGGPPAIDAAELKDIGNSIMQNQTNIGSLQTDNTQNQSNIEQLQEWKTSAEPLLSGALQKSGGTMTGNLILNANPTQNMQAATKEYVDNTFGWTLIQTDSVTINTSKTVTFNTPSALLDVSTAYSEIKILFALNISLQNSSSTYVQVDFGGTTRPSYIATQFVEDGAKQINLKERPIIYYGLKCMWVNSGDHPSTLAYAMTRYDGPSFVSGADALYGMYFGSTYELVVVRASVNGKIYFYGR